MEKTIIKKIILAVGAILIVAGLLAYLLSSLEGVVIPADFTAARQKAAIVSQDIVNITNETGKSIELANRAESEGDLQRILGLIEEAKKSNTLAYQKAFELSQSIQQMAESLKGVQSVSQQIGFEAVAMELSLVSEFISYTGTLNDFLNNLAKSVSNGTANGGTIGDNLRDINNRVVLINALNRNFADKMAAFDRYSDQNK
ncbi:MAG: hypothetical protein AAB377_01775 [Patescibacteria group bacterium]